MPVPSTILKLTDNNQLYRETVSLSRGNLLFVGELYGQGYLSNPADFVSNLNLENIIQTIKTFGSMTNDIRLVINGKIILACLYLPKTKQPQK